MTEPLPLICPDCGDVWFEGWGCRNPECVSNQRKYTKAEFERDIAECKKLDEKAKEKVNLWRKLATLSHKKDVE